MFGGWVTKAIDTTSFLLGSSPFIIVSTAQIKALLPSAVAKRNKQATAIQTFCQRVVISRRYVEYIVFVCNEITTKRL